MATKFSWGGAYAAATAGVPVEVETKGAPGDVPTLACLVCGWGCSDEKKTGTQLTFFISPATSKLRLRGRLGPRLGLGAGSVSALALGVAGCL